MFNSSALPRFNTATSKGTAFLGNTRDLTAQYVTDSLAVAGEADGCTRTSASAKLRHCSAFWTNANCIADNFNGVRKCAHLCGLTFELLSSPKYRRQKVRRRMI